MLALVVEVPEGYAVAQIVDALHYRPAGRGFDSRWGLKIFIDFVLPAALCARGSIQPLTEMSTRDLPWEVKAAGA
jgi:hypothetical protein